MSHSALPGEARLVFDLWQLRIILLSVTDVLITWLNGTPCGNPKASHFSQDAANIKRQVRCVLKQSVSESMAKHFSDYTTAKIYIYNI